MIVKVGSTPRTKQPRAQVPLMMLTEIKVQIAHIVIRPRTRPYIHRRSTQRGRGDRPHIVVPFQVYGQSRQSTLMTL